MSQFYIKELSLTGSDIETSSLQFIDGLNIIYGPSDAGKSYILDCIDFMFGSKAATFPLSEDSGYDCVNMHIATPRGNLKLKRKFGENYIYADSTDPEISSERYTHKTISSVWLRLMGINAVPKIIYKRNFERKHLTIRGFLHTFFIKEDNITKKESIFLQPMDYTATYILSALHYLLTGNALEEIDPFEESRIRKLRKNAVIKFINSNISSLTARKNTLAEKTIPHTEDIYNKINGILNEITQAEGKISSAVAKSRKLSKEIYSTNEQFAECSMLYKRYKMLESQYSSDVKRLTFIVEGELKKEDITETVNCPFCNNVMTECTEESYIESVQAELANISCHINDLKEAENDIIAEGRALKKRIKKLQDERSEIEVLINSELKPRIKLLRSTLTEYRASIEIHHESSVLDDLQENMIQELKNIESENESNIKYTPRDYFNEEIIEKINAIHKDILQWCNFENLNSVQFNLTSFDTVINNKPKSTYGQGYRAFLNTVSAITLSKYLSECGMFSPGLLIVDSPILSLKEKSTEKASDIMKTSLFRYLTKHTDKCQTIIVENEIPDIDYSNVNLIEFTKDKEHGRYGFLKGIE